MYDEKARADYISRQVRMAGEELIRRSEQMNLGGFDLSNELLITITVKPEADHIPDISFEFCCLNKIALDKLIEKF